MTNHPRRLRNNPLIRNLTAQTQLHTNDFVFPIFITEGENKKQSIKSMPNIYRYSIDRLNEIIDFSMSNGINKFMLFGIPDKKDAQGILSTKSSTIIYKALDYLKKQYSNIFLITDVCFCEYTTHGHCGIINNHTIDNDATLEILSKQALLHAQGGADMIAPSGKMDNTVATLRDTLDKSGFKSLPIMSYSVKYHSSFYGPFREAVKSSPSFGDRSSYQMDYRNSDEALKESIIHQNQGADILVVKPALAYLDIINQVSKNCLLPIAAYQVSGEYSMIENAANAGLIQRENIILETLTAIKRAGAKILISYFANEVQELIKI